MSSQTKQYFGTDGIRDKANFGNMTADIALKVGIAAGSLFRNGNHSHRVVIGKDTRLSGYMLEPALTAGFVSVGMNVILVGPMPTPAISMLTRSMRADLGVMLSASHNPFYDNGIKIFDPFGLKLSDEKEMEIESIIKGETLPCYANSNDLGRAKRLDDAQGRYIEFVKHSFPRRKNLSGLKVVVDCANGAAYKIAPIVLWELGAKVTAINVSPDGFNINEACGSTTPESMCAKVVEEGADLGIALDGDADRLVVCDEKGKLIDGDQIMAAIACHQQAIGKLRGGGVIATHMSNMGLERYLEGINLTLHRTDIGDRYVSGYMREHGFNVGGEQSGHIILHDYTTTGDGLIAGLQLLSMLVDAGKPASEVFHLFDPVPQVLKNISYDANAHDPLADPDIKACINDAKATLGTKGRVLIRKSGTEPLIRLMVEGDDEQQIQGVVNQVSQSMKRVVGG